MKTNEEIVEEFTKKYDLRYFDGSTYAVTEEFTNDLLTTLEAKDKECEERLREERERVKVLSVKYFEKGLEFNKGSINDSIFQELKVKYLTPTKTDKQTDV